MLKVNILNFSMMKAKGFRDTAKNIWKLSRKTTTERDKQNQCLERIESFATAVAAVLWKQVLYTVKQCLYLLKSQSPSEWSLDTLGSHHSGISRSGRPVAYLGGIVLTGNWWGRAQPTVGNTIPRRVALGYIKKLSWVWGRIPASEQFLCGSCLCSGSDFP